MTDRYVCVHGHFYQPPRENPSLEVIELQDSAYPYHDWNERVTAECYGPNARSRILDGEGRIERIVNNYSRLSFNFGPTLLKWLEDEAGDVYQAVLDADRESAARFSGHGSALAQAWGHLIMPLANSRDKRTQALWGIRDFEHRFGRRPEGMWLPETAVDAETLDVLAQLGVSFTILAPHQAARVRHAGGRAWKDVSGGAIDPTRPYFVQLPSGRKLAVFFYDGPAARAVAFEGLLQSGEQFANRLAAGFSDQRPWPQLVHIATDGESYGHHHRHGDMALAAALERLEQSGIALTNYGEYLERHPAQHEVEVFENTSWSCGHGVERWRGDCGCNTGGRPEWHQAWRAPLREALDQLRDQAAPRFEEKARHLLRDPWAARDDYINVILDREPESLERFFRRHATHELDEGDRVTALKLLELQRHAMLMYTSCGWFFDDIAGIEATQVIQYAGRVIQLSREVLGDGLEPAFLEALAQAQSNEPEQGDGRQIYERSVGPAAVNLRQIAAHFAVSSLFEAYPQAARVFCYNVGIEDYKLREAGQARLAAGRVRLTSVITGEWDVLMFAVLHLGDHNLTAGVRKFTAPEAYAAMVGEVMDHFSRADLPEVVRALDRHFAGLTYSMKALFRDEQRKVLETILASTLAEAESSYRQIFEHHAPLMRFLRDVGFPLPDSFRTAAELVLNGNLRRLLEEEPIDSDRVSNVLREAGVWGSPLEAVGLAYAAERTLERLARRFAESPRDLEALRALESSVSAVRLLPFAVDLSGVQNCYYEALQEAYPERRARAGLGDEGAGAWLALFLALGVNLAVRVE
ncbi:MAG: DUF3536 domain-containing protein [Dehalococcoidia bacterium]|nr:DUF3536 domain-containing protein [Dehalococcoidia bacterium]